MTWNPESDGVGPRVDPDVDPTRHVAEELVGDHRAGDEQDQPDQDVAAPPGRHEEHGQEDAEEEERRAEVLAEDDDQHDDHEDGEHRQQIRQRRDLHRADADARIAQQRPVLGQVAGDEDDQHDLDELARLEADRPQVDPQARSVHLGPEQEREDQERDAGQCPRVLVVPQPAIVPQSAGRVASIATTPIDEPQELGLRNVQVEAERAACWPGPAPAG